ncbi:MAG TPA: LuxR C-terminal-related transcriptional regulator [Noviherbaspirillum sp.]|nr:LuxR C-terminal-related transcriptional regulator [Noviherbaspirillum sp.]
MLDKYSATVDTIYAAATGSARWEDALHAVEELTDSAGAVIGFVPKQESAAAFNLAGRFTSEQCATYSKQYQPICRRTRFMMDHPDLSFVCDSMLITETEMNTDPVYDWFGQHDLRYFIGGSLPETQQHRPVWSLQRSPAQGHVQRKDVHLFNLLTPHMGRALTLADQIGTLRAFQRFSSAMLEALPQAVFALDAQGRLLFANGPGGALLGCADGLTAGAGHLRTASSTEQSKLDQMIRSAIAPLDGPAGGWTRVSRPSGRLPYAVFVAPLSFADDELAAAEAKVLVMVHDTGDHRSADPDMLTSLYCLTETEARLASALSAGHSVESAAALLHIQPSTARAHLKHVFNKVGVNRQQDLVRLLTSLSALSPPA